MLGTVFIFSASWAWKLSWRLFSYRVCSMYQGTENHHGLFKDCGNVTSAYSITNSQK
jgi:hypothetical protein